MIFYIVLAVILIYFIMTYNSLVNIKNNVSKAWANIDVLLKQRHDELPKLVDTCKQYMKYEQETLGKVIKARSSVSEARESQNVTALGTAESMLRSGLGQLFALAESYPDLKADEQFLHLQSRISGLENAIADRREFYNDSVNINNVRIAQFPDLILARLFDFKSQDLLKFSVEELTDVDINQRFNA
ncbi:MAG: LemA family protein [Methylotenera sp.]